MAEAEQDTDQYDTLLRAMESGLLITVNCSSPTAYEFGEMEVVYSDPRKTAVDLKGWGEQYYRIHRDRRGELVIAETSDDGLRRGYAIETIEILGVGGGR